MPLNANLKNPDAVVRLKDAIERDRVRLYEQLEHVEAGTGAEAQVAGSRLYRIFALMGEASSAA